jgi:predicted O-methyltransferase YrrM
VSNTWTLAPHLLDYLRASSLREPALLTQLRAETAQHPRASMQIAPEQGQLMGLLVQLMGARRTLEVGVFTGYSSLAVALALPEDGHITACDVSDEFTQIARRYWAAAGVSHKITLHLAPAVQTLDTLLRDGAAGSYDLAFLDADKSRYDAYYERALQLLRRGGLIIVDNVLWDGRAADPLNDEPDTVAIRALNAKIARDERVTVSMLPIGDGLTLAVKR